MIGETVTVVRTVESTDDYGNTIHTDDVSTEVTCLGFDPGGSIAIRNGRDGTDTKPTVYLPSGTDLAHTDKIEIRGSTYQIEGEIADWRNPFTGDRPGLVVPLRRVSG